MIGILPLKLPNTWDLFELYVHDFDLFGKLLNPLDNFLYAKQMSSASHNEIADLLVTLSI